MTCEPEHRLPAHLEVAGMIRRVQAAGGFASVTAKGERDAGTIMFVTTCNGRNYQAWERMPQVDGTRQWEAVRSDEHGYGEAFSAWLDRRRTQDSDLWIVELDIADAAQFIGFAPRAG
ncbi:MAG: DUF1491 family protein [Novosphingobium sp.]